MADCYCEKCGKTMDEGQFYTYKNGTKTELCKKCLTMHIDNFDPETYLWLLEKMDVPYVPQEWNVLRDKAFAKNPNLNGMSVFGKYLSKMRLKQWKDFGWADSEAIQQENEARSKEREEVRLAAEAKIKEDYEEGKISEAEYRTMVSTSEQNKRIQESGGIPDPIAIANVQNPFQDANAFIDEEELTGPAAELTDDDRLYLAMKWGRLYKPNEWVELEKSYEEMMASFDIQDADTQNTLILLCKTNLKMNQAIDLGDLDGFQKLSRVSDSLRKSAKFTAAQNKEEKDDFVDSVGELVTLCERDGFIPRFATDIPQDKVDLTLKDMNNYVHKLVTQDLGFGQQIEDALKKIQIQQQMNQDAENSKDEDGNETVIELNDKDYENFYDTLNQDRQKDKKAELEEEDV